MRAWGAVFALFLGASLFASEPSDDFDCSAALLCGEIVPSNPLLFPAELQPSKSKFDGPRLQDLAARVERARAWFKKNAVQVRELPWDTAAGALNEIRPISPLLSDGARLALQEKRGHPPLFEVLDVQRDILNSERKKRGSHDFQDARVVALLTELHEKGIRIFFDPTISFLMPARRYHALWHLPRKMKTAILDWNSDLGQFLGSLRVLRLIHSDSAPSLEKLKFSAAMLRRLERYGIPRTHWNNLVLVASEAEAHPRRSLKFWSLSQLKLQRQFNGTLLRLLEEERVPGDPTRHLKLETFAYRSAVILIQTSTAAAYGGAIVFALVSLNQIVEWLMGYGGDDGDQEPSQMSGPH